MGRESSLQQSLDPRNHQLPITWSLEAEQDDTHALRVYVHLFLRKSRGPAAAPTSSKAGGNVVKAYTGWLEDKPDEHFTMAYTGWLEDKSARAGKDKADHNVRMAIAGWLEDKSAAIGMGKRFKLSMDRGDGTFPVSGSEEALRIQNCGVVGTSPRTGQVKLLRLA
ncbi:hypothetical protein BU16DRAFT_565602 [Lophium mytilinum]|uniref:Uncharacterized protein n=1 Tax=Lophium mytilinum TaxID=390894 RepID=A0A6A6QKH9_9PEZI|nr:hypothetical protein BU16DRAFT_565602 [Lophium mytilinum]